MKKILIISLLLLLASCDAQKISGPVSTPEPNAPSSVSGANNKTGSIELSEKSAKTEKLSKVSSYGYDFDSDGQSDTVILYSNAKPDASGKMLWDDFHQWLLEVELASGGFYTLFNSSVSTGQLYFEVSEIYNDEVTPAITTYLTTGSSLDIKQFIFEDNKFTESTVYSTEDISSGGINRVYSSIPQYK